MHATRLLIAVAILLVILVVFTNVLDTPKSWVMNKLSVKENLEDEQPTTDLPVNAKNAVILPENTTSDVLKVMGYGEDTVAWEDYIAADALDPSTFVGHQEFVKDISPINTGAGFTAVDGENGSPIFTNFRGLRRPEHVPIGATARQVPDVDETVLQHNKPFRW